MSSLNAPVQVTQEVRIAHGIWGLIFSQIYEDERFFLR